jgi:hypothetical protein
MGVISVEGQLLIVPEDTTVPSIGGPPSIAPHDAELPRLATPLAVSG